MVRDTIINGYRRLAKEFVFWAVPASLGMLSLRTGLCEECLTPFTVYSVYYWDDSTYHFQNRKAGHIAAMKEGGEGHH